MMTCEEILKDIHSDRVKKVIVDGDFAAEIDDQFALAYALGSDKMEVIAVNAEAYYEEPVAVDTEEVMLRSYEILKDVYKKVKIPADKIPFFEGARSRIGSNPGFAPSDSPAARNIIKAAKESDEPIYILVTGPASNAVSACLLDPSIMDNIIIVFVGGRAIEFEEENRPFHEWNIHADQVASKYLFNLDVPVIMLPADPHGSADIRMVADDFDKIEGDSEGAVLFRETYPLYECCKGDNERYRTNFNKAMCDFIAPATLTVPDALDFSIISAPVWCDDCKYAFDSTRKKIIYGIRPNSDMIVAEAIKCINNTIRKYE